MVYFGSNYDWFGMIFLNIGRYGKYIFKSVNEIGEKYSPPLLGTVAEKYRKLG